MSDLHQETLQQPPQSPVHQPTEITHEAAARIIPELLPEAAALTRTWASTLCVPSIERHQGCSAYHGAWTTLRQLGVISGARTDRDFFLAQFGQLEQRVRNPRILIAGSADHAMLHMVLEAFQASGNTPRITVVDSCATPLALNKWYGKQIGVPIETVQADLRLLRLPQRFDMIVTHSVFSFMTLDAIEAALRCWKELLAPAGRLALVQGVRPALTTGQFIEFSPADEKNFIARVRDCSRTNAQASGLGQDDIERLAQQFAQHKRLRAIARIEDITDTLARAGYQGIEASQVNRQQLKYHSSAPQADEKAFSLRIVATAPPVQASEGSAS